MISTLQIGQQWWRTWRESSVNSRIFAAMVTVGGFAVLVKVVAGVKELVVAYRFGTTDVLDAFIMAFLLPQFVMELIGGSLNAAFIPTYVEVREREGREAAQRLFASVMMSSIVLVIAASVLLTFLIAYILPVLASGFSPEKLELTRRLYFLLVPTLLFSALATVWNAVLNAGEQFALGAVMPGVTSLMIIVFLLGMGDRYGIFTLALATVFGLALEAMLLGWGLKRQGISLRPRWYGPSPAVKQVLRQYAPALAAAFLMGSTWLIAQSMAAMLGPGSVSALAYGSKVTAVLLGIGSVAVSTAVLPHFSHMVALRNWSGIRHTLVTYARLILMITLPVTIILVYFSEPIVAFLFQRGAFSESDTHVVGRVQALFLLQVPIYIAGIMLVRLVSSLKANRLLMWGAVLNLSLNIIFNYIFMKSFAVEGIALATSLMYLVSCCYLLFVSLRLLKKTSQ